MDHLILAWKLALMIINRKQNLLYCAVPADHREKTKESEKREKYFDLASELRKLWNMRVIVIPLVISAFKKIPKDLERGLKELEIGGRIQTMALLRSDRILWSVQEIWGDLLSLGLLCKELTRREYGCGTWMWRWYQ